jgi:DNA-binding transcriptional ArsR family regulator
MKDQEKVFSALSSQARLDIIRLLGKHALCVNALVRKLDISQPAVSQHLKVLENAGLIKGDKRGPFVHYCLVPDTLLEMKTFLDKLTGR